MNITLPVFLYELLVAADLPEAEHHEPHRSDDHEDGLHEVSPDNSRQAPACHKYNDRDTRENKLFSVSIVAIGNSIAAGLVLFQFGFYR